LSKRETVIEIKMPARSASLVSFSALPRSASVQRSRANVQLEGDTEIPNMSNIEYAECYIQTNSSLSLVKVYKNSKNFIVTNFHLIVLILKT